MPIVSQYYRPNYFYRETLIGSAYRMTAITQHNSDLISDVYICQELTLLYGLMDTGSHFISNDPQTIRFMQ